ncbi:sugar phosphate isomerase/epimerase [Microbacterium esteraromaticum]|uniref:Sugar phosphate isomerase/epimerase n=2 Tax=Microbacterium esteraromaticum TaxID=57043 RepID=A0A7D8AJ23_9MICO|nr:sugar phosphate isomerase/epimerase [Microbacterium esteraromaticum]
MSRRTMLKALAASSVAVSLGGAAFGASAATAAPPAHAADGKGARLVPKSRIGIQLFTVRDKVASVGFRAVFEELAEIGFSDVEFAGYTQGNVGPITIAEIRRLLDDNGLRATGSHVNLTPANIDQQIEIAHQLGTQFLGQGGPITRTNTVSGWTTAAQTWNEMGAKAAASGIRLYAHNHAGEFGFTSDDPTRRVYDLLWDEFDPALVAFEMDVFWAHVGQHLSPGFSPIDYVLRDPDRFPLLHLKDGKLNPESGNGYDIIEFGAGDIDYQSFLAPLRNRGQRWGMYEQDNAATTAVAPNPLDSLGNAARSYRGIEGLRGGDASGR